MANRTNCTKFLFLLFCVFTLISCSPKKDYNSILIADWNAIENSYFNQDYDKFINDFQIFTNNFGTFNKSLEYDIYNFLGSDTNTYINSQKYKEFIDQIQIATALIQNQIDNECLDFSNQETYSAIYQIRSNVIQFQIINQENALTANKFLLNTLIVIGSLFVALATFLFITLKKYEKELDDSEQFNAYSTILVEGIEKERHRFSKEIHDTVLQDIRAIQLEAELQNPNKDKILEMSKNTIITLRKICSNHTPPELAKLTSKNGYFLLPAILNYCTDFFAQTSINLTTKVQEDIKVEEETNNIVQKNLHIFRILQEAFNNVAYHSKAKNISLLIRNKTSTDSKTTFLIFIVNDDGIGFDTTSFEKSEKIHKTDGNHFGLTNMQERCKIINANLQIISEPGEGTQVILEVPLNK